MPPRQNKKKSFGSFIKGFDNLGDFKTFMIKGSKNYQTIGGALFTLVCSLLTFGYSALLLS